MKSMTAFGRGQAVLSDGSVTVELRSVNSRFLDVGVRIPRVYGALEPRFKPYLQSRGIQRGKVDVTVTVTFDGDAGGALSLDRTAAAEYIAALRVLRDEFGLADDISVMQVAQRPDLFVKENREIDPDTAWEQILQALAPAVDAFLSSREAEGQRLEADIRQKLDSVGERVKRIGQHAENTLLRYRERLTARVREAMADSGFAPDEGRLLTECAVFADRIAIDEELVRLASHLVSFGEMVTQEGAGRRLDFLMQEMNREANTIGSKCADAAIALEVVEIKCTLEKIREQIQNIE